ncbi:hypothetical protein ACFQZ4_00710 [Catellatospora coxensis]
MPGRLWAAGDPGVLAAPPGSGSSTGRPLGTTIATPVEMIDPSKSNVLATSTPGRSVRSSSRVP